MHTHIHLGNLIIIYDAIKVNFNCKPTELCQFNYPAHRRQAGRGNRMRQLHLATNRASTICEPFPLVAIGNLSCDQRERERDDNS